MNSDIEILNYIESLNITEDSVYFTTFQQLNLLEVDLFRLTLSLLISKDLDISQIASLVTINDITVQSLVQTVINGTNAIKKSVTKNLVDSGLFTFLNSYIRYPYTAVLSYLTTDLFDKYNVLRGTIDFLEVKDKYFSDILLHPSVVSAQNTLESEFLLLKSAGINITTIHQLILKSNTEIRFVSTSMSTETYLSSDHPIGFVLRRLYRKGLLGVNDLNLAINEYVNDSSEVTLDDPFLADDFALKMANTSWNDIDSYASKAGTLKSQYHKLIAYYEVLTPFIKQFHTLPVVNNDGGYQLLERYFDAAYDFLNAISTQVKENI